MKKIPQTDEVSSAPLDPVIPGTEEPRSLGDMLREAELEQEARATQSSEAHATEAETADKPKPAKKVSLSQSRRYAREKALQALYQWDVSGGQSSDVRTQFMEKQDMGRVDVEYFTRLFNGVSHNPELIDATLFDALDRPIAELDPIERGVLRVAAFELTECPDIPARVVINEGIEITKRYGADKGHRYVNGVLDKLALAVRPLEMRKR
ncbi:transcription antitermination factor NusB [Granulosicoccus antarcticus]|uniref:Transcription antitermination protein NusB n=1 Tax=Granulosicoccus antarcticus IMCC3135 TaxID=1192854 RepID=A0A2Z2NVA8_9GAMM|nr:transcription antitermination factor NusB [Granulosicoccus antarcticus]ASJ74445.1 N utilization substance protein B [Granulosicoccus antarcticus IMCC3135]